MRYVTAEELKPRLTADQEIAFVDVREHGQYGEGHPFFCVPLPFSTLESRAQALLPRKSVDIVLLDDDDGVAARAAERLSAEGYTNVAVLEGGAAGWAAAGYTLYKGVNVPSKTFGELLEHAAGTPRVTSAELEQWRGEGADLIVLDGRSPTEFRKMSLPAAHSCPNAELAYRLRYLAPDESTRVVVNCAGRTRSILGVENLRLAAVGNPVFALENGTQGWRLAGYDLEHGVEPAALPEPDDAELLRLQELAAEIVREHDLARVSDETVERWLRNGNRTTYVFDVRTAEEFAGAHWPGAVHAPGGQLVQATDEYVAVRNARIVLSDDVGLRAAITAVRLRQMGHDACLLDADATAFPNPDSAAGNGETYRPDAERFRRAVDGASAILDASPSMAFRAAHVDGAVWVTRARLDRLDPQEPVLVTGRDWALVDAVAADLERRGVSVAAFPAGPHLWTEAGCRVVASADAPPDRECIDYLFFVHDRHDGNLDASRRYLEWETGLVGQLDAQERSVFDLRT